MADNVVTNEASGGAVFATDDDGTAHHPYVKLEFGPDNTQTKVADSNGARLPVKVGESVLPTGAATQATLASVLTAAEAVQAAVEGTLTVAGEVSLDSASLAALELVGIKGADGSAIAGNANPLPISDAGGSLTVDGTVAVTDGGGSITVDGTVTATIAAGATTIAKAEDAAHASGDVGVMALAVRSDADAATAADGDYVPLQTDDNGYLKVNVKAGSGSGTEYTEDAAAAANPQGPAIIVIRDDSRTGSLTSADGDNVALRGTNAGELYVKHVDAIPVTDNGGSLTVDGTVAVSGTVDVSGSAVEISDGGNTITVDGTVTVQDGGGSLTVDDGGGSITVDGTVTATIAAGATTIAKAEDSAHTTGDVGVMGLTVRSDTAAATAGTDGDYQAQISNARGATWVAIEDGAGGQITSFGGGTQYTEDAAAAANPVGNALIVVRDDSRAGSVTSADGDNIALRGTNAGEVYVKHVDSIPVTDNGGSLTVDGEVALDAGTVTALETPDTSAVSGSVTSAATLFTQDMDGYESITVQVTSAGTSCTVAYECSEDNTNWAACTGLPSNSNGSLPPASSTTTAAITQFPRKARYFRARVSTYGSGTVSVVGHTSRVAVTQVVASYNAYLTPTAISIPKAEDSASANGDVGVPAMAVQKATPANTAGSDGDYEMLQMSNGRLWASADQTFAGVAASVGAGAVGTGVQRVTLASDDPLVASLVADDAAFTVGTTKLMPVGFFADEASTDSIDEGGLGAARITLDRKQIVTPYVHAAAGGHLPFKNLDVDETEDDIKTSAGKLFWLHVINRSASVRYLKLYNATAANVTVGTTTPVLTLPIPTLATTNGAGFTIHFGDAGLAFDTAICIAATTGFADNDTGAPGANDVIVNGGYI